MIQMSIILAVTVIVLIGMCAAMFGALNTVNGALVNRKHPPLNALQSTGLILVPSYVVTALIVRCMWLYFFG